MRNHRNAHSRELYYLATTPTGKFDKEYVECDANRDSTGSLAEGNACCSCPTGAICKEGSSVETIDVLPKYYRHAPTSPQVLECPHKPACIGIIGNKTKDACDAAYAGPLCSRCSSNYYRDSFSMDCMDCAEGGATDAISTFTAFMVRRRFLYSAPACPPAHHPAFINHPIHTTPKRS